MLPIDFLVHNNNNITQNIAAVHSPHRVDPQSA